MQAKIWNFSEWIAETNPQKIREHFDALLRKSGVQYPPLYGA